MEESLLQNQIYQMLPCVHHAYASKYGFTSMTELGQSNYLRITNKIKIKTKNSKKVICNIT